MREKAQAVSADFAAESSLAFVVSRSPAPLISRVCTQEERGDGVEYPLAAGRWPGPVAWNVLWVKAQPC